jgi:hypothetical protein
LLNPNFEVQDSRTTTSSKRPALIKKADNRAVSPDLRIENFDPVKAIDESDELVNAIDQMLKNFHLDDNQSENQSKNSSDDQHDDQPKEIIQPRRSGRKRRASKLAEGMIQYDHRKKMPRANVIRNKFSYKKIPKSLIHMTRVLAILTAEQLDEPQTLRDAMQRPD